MRRVVALAAFVLAMLPAQAMAVLASVTGHVTSHLTGAPLGGVRVAIDLKVSPFGGEAEIGSTYTDADGLYAWSLELSGAAWCTVRVVDPPYLAAASGFTPDGTVYMVDLALLTPATVTGDVSFAAGDATGMTVLAEHFVEASGFWDTVGSSVVATDGHYAIGALPPDDYRFCTERTDNGAVPQCFDHVDLPPVATDPGATVVAVAEGVAIGSIDFDLAEGGTLSGTIYDGFLGTPLTSHSGGIFAYDINGDIVFGTAIDADGHFHLRGLPDGAYYLGASTDAVFVDGIQFYPDIVCTPQNCPPPTTGTLLTIAGANEIDGLDFTFHPDIVVQGHVLDADTAAPLGGVQVGLFSFGGTPMTLSEPDGAYTFYWYADKPLEVGAFSASPHIDTVYPGVSCLGGTCLGEGTTLQSTTGSVLTGIDLPMALGAVISGRVTRSDNGAADGDALIEIYDDTFNEIWSGVTFESAYALPAWIAGTYYAEATGFDPLSGCAFYLDRPCPDDGNPAEADATPIVVAAGDVRADIDFHLAAADPVFASSFEYGF